MPLGGGYPGGRPVSEGPVAVGSATQQRDAADARTRPGATDVEFAPPATTAVHGRRISLGICCMEKKVKNPPMQAILRRLELSGDFDIIIFPEETILNASVAAWPKVRCLIAFSSTGFPLDKCVEYCALVNPVVVNDLEAQRILTDRVQVYRTLQDWSIPCPDYLAIDHLANDDHVLIENEDEIIYNGQKVRKPFVEKPQDGDRHDIYVYYPQSAGGGVKKLFRKEKDKSSEFDVECNTIRRDGLYIYEKFLPTQGTDIKVYTVGAEYVHAEARKAPTIDGKVERSKDGKEVRYPVVLTQQEKAISAFIVQAFRQKVCGFDILRTENRSIVCDVNGWSFVKGNQKYYNDCGVLIRRHFFDTLGLCDSLEGSAKSQGIQRMILRPGEEIVNETHKEWQQDTQEKERLRCVIVVMRHGDRRPKEKLKFKSKLPALLSYFNGSRQHRDAEGGDCEVKLRTPEEMEALNALMRETAMKIRSEIVELKAICQENATASASDQADSTVSANSGADKPDKPGKSDRASELKTELQNVELLIEVLEMKDRFSGLERKVQLKVAKWKSNKEDNDEVAKGGKDGVAKVSQVLVVAKWGGELTIAGLQQAEALGRKLRHTLYGDDPMSLVRLHSSFRHDFKIYSSQEGRCQITAASFTKGFLDLEGDITPILVSLVTCDNFARSLLDEPIPKEKRDAVKQKIDAFIARNDDLGAPETIDAACPTGHADLQEAARRIGRPLALLHRLKDMSLRYIDSMTESIAQLTLDMREHGTDVDGSDVVGITEMLRGIGPLPSPKSKRTGMVPRGPGPQVPFELKDELLRRWLHLRRKERRWRKLIHGLAKPRDPAQGFADDNVSYDASKIPELWDNVYYDLMTHRQVVGEASCAIAEQLADMLQPLNDWVSWSEYGISRHEKLCIGTDVNWRLIGKILVDLEFMLGEGAATDEAGRTPFENAGHGSGSNEHDFTASPSKADPISLVPISIAAEQPPEAVAEAPAVAKQGEDWFKLGRGLARLQSAGYDDDARSLQVAESQADAPKIGQPGFVTPENSELRQGKSKRNAPLIHDELKRGLRDPLDWHPRLSEEVARVTGITSTQRVKSRIYSTSASTLHALFNVLWHGQERDSIVSGIGHITDLNYLSHMVFRCYELADDDPRVASASAESGISASQAEKGRYRVEISMSPGVQVTEEGQQTIGHIGANLRSEKCGVAPLQIVTEAAALDRVEQFLTEVVKEYGNKSVEESQDEGT